MTIRVILAAAIFSLTGGCSTVDLVPMTNPQSKTAVDCSSPLYNDFLGPFASDRRIENECIAACRRHGFRTPTETGATAAVNQPELPLSEEAASLTPADCKP